MLVRRTGETWQPAETVPIAGETEFQALVVETFRQVLATQTDAPAVIAREIVMPDGGRLDILALDADGVISLCECKRAVNPDVRRKVVGQILEYGGSLAPLTFKDFKTRVEARLGEDLTAAMAGQAGEDFDADTWEDTIEENLAAGRFRLIVVVDEINEGLKRTLLYLNAHTDIPVLGAELRHVRYGDIEVIAPQVFAGELARVKLPGTTAAPPIERTDTLVVAATHAFGEYQRIGAYICQPTRSFRTDTAKYLGFYAKRRIEPVFPRIVSFRPNILFTPENAARLKASNDPVDQQVGVVIDKALADDVGPPRNVGEHYQVVVLDEGFEIAHEIRHLGGSAWLRGHRYTISDALKKAPGTTAELQAHGG